MIELLRGVQRQPSRVSPHHRAERALQAERGNQHAGAPTSARGAGERVGAGGEIGAHGGFVLLGLSVLWLVCVAQPVLRRDAQAMHARSRRVQGADNTQVITVRGMQRRHRAT